jgi:hypothetical protein
MFFGSSCLIDTTDSKSNVKLLLGAFTFSPENGFLRPDNIAATSGFPAGIHSKS